MLDVIVPVFVPVVVMLRTDVTGLLVPSAVRLVGLKVQVDPVGRPVQVRAIVPVKPLVGVRVKVVWPVCPCFNVNAAGLAVMVKSGDGAVTATDSAVDWEP